MDNSLCRVKQFLVWESAYDLYDWTDTVPDVTGVDLKVVADGLLPKKAASKVPTPKCKNYGYSTWEWFLHWKDVLKDTVIGVSPSEMMSEYKRMLDARGAECR